MLPWCFLAMVITADAAGYADYDPPPPMPATQEVTGLAPWEGRDAVWMFVPGEADDVERRLLLVSDRADIEEAVLTGDLRGATVLVVELAAGRRADDDGITELFNFNGGVRRDDRGRWGQGVLQSFDATPCEVRAVHAVRSGYVKWRPSNDPARTLAVVNVGFAAGQALQARLAVRYVPWMAHVHSTAGLACSPTYGG